MNTTLTYSDDNDNNRRLSMLGVRINENIIRILEV